MKDFKNIIFDLGGVILDIDYKKTISAFEQLGIKDASFLYSKSSQVSVFDDLEKAYITEKDFYDSIRKLSNSLLSDEQIRSAWNAILVGLPEENVELLTTLKANYRLFLLSNTNIIHEKEYRKMITGSFGKFVFDDLFEKMYLSHHLHLRKPDTSIFEYVMNDSSLVKSETLFIDDSPQHVEGARQAGLNAYHLKDKNIQSFFSEDYPRLISESFNFLAQFD